jgi:hypothetical protein
MLLYEATQLVELLLQLTPHPEPGPVTPRPALHGGSCSLPYNLPTDWSTVYSIYIWVRKPYRYPSRDIFHLPGLRQFLPGYSLCTLLGCFCVVLFAFLLHILIRFFLNLSSFLHFPLFLFPVFIYPPPKKKICITPGGDIFLHVHPYLQLKLMN